MGCGSSVAEGSAEKGAKENGQLLFDAASAGEEAKALELMEQGADIKWKDRVTGSNTILMASTKGLSGLVRKLLSADAEVNSSNSGGLTCLMAASQGGHTEVVRILLEAGANKKAVNATKETAQNLASKAGHPDVTELLTAEDGRSLYNAVMCKQVQEAVALIEKGADINFKDAEYGATVLLVASNRGLPEVVRKLLAADADVNAQQSQGYSCLMTAACGGSGAHTEVVRMLLEAGADKTAKNKAGETALDLAKKANKKDIVGLLAAQDGRSLYNAVMCRREEEALALIEKGTDVHFTDSEYGASVLLVACNRGLPQLVRKLLAADADANAKQSYGYSCLMTAASGGHAEVVTLLLEAGADTTTKNNAGETALDLANKGGHAEVVKLLTAEDGRSLYNAVMCKQESRALGLIDKGADVNFKDAEYGASVLLVASNRGLVEVVRKLLAGKADVNAQQSYGYSCLMTAASGGHAEVVALLLEAGADKTAKNKTGDTALDLATKGRKKEVVKLLS